MQNGRQGLGFLLLLAIALGLYFSNPLTGIATRFNQEVFVSGGLIYGSLRAVTSAMSVVRDVDIQGSLGVASLAGSPGQALQPVIATIERMANLLFALTLASGVLSVTLPAVSGLGAVVMAVGAAGSALVALFGAGWPHALRQAAAACLRLGLLAAVIVPASYALAFMVGDRMTADAWQSASAVFDRQSAELEGVVALEVPVTPAPEDFPESEVPAADGGLIGWIWGVLSGAVQGSGEAIQGAVTATADFANAVRDQFATNARVVADGLAAAGQLFDASVKIGVAYLVKLVVLPLLILFGFAFVLRAARGPETVQVSAPPPVLPPPAQ